MSRLGYGYGSEWQLLHWLAYHRNELNAVVERAIVDGKAEAARDSRRYTPAEAFAVDTIHWLDVAWSGKPADREQDQEWQGVNFVADDAVKAAWCKFWPQSGRAQCWDAVGWRATQGGREWLLIEAKAHMDELFAPTHAKGPGLTMIGTALQNTRAALGVDNGNRAVAESWLLQYYQYANRLAALHFLNDIARDSGDRAVRARLIVVYFTGESMRGRNCPASATEWDHALEGMYKSLGLLDEHGTFRKSGVKRPLMDHVHEVYLPVSKA
jgi:hypothetical protein